MNKEKLNTLWIWYKQTAMLLGMPVLFIILSMGAQRLFFTATCQTVGVKCEYAFGATDAMTNYMSELLEHNPGMDIVARKR